jgi:hypothetical protein
MSFGEYAKAFWAGWTEWGRRQPMLGGGPARGELARQGRTQEGIQMEIKFQILNEFGIWLDFEKIYKKI